MTSQMLSLLSHIHVVNINTYRRQVVAFLSMYKYEMPLILFGTCCWLDWTRALKKWTISANSVWSISAALAITIRLRLCYFAEELCSITKYTFSSWERQFNSAQNFV